MMRHITPILALVLFLFAVLALLQPGGGETGPAADLHSDAAAKAGPVALTRGESREEAASERENGPVTTNSPRRQEHVASRILGRVIDEQGRPVEGARVTVSSFGPEVRGPEGGIGTTETNADGSYRVPALARGWLVVHAWHPGVGTGLLNLTPELWPLPAKLEDITLFELGVLEGQVVDSEGRPLPRIGVRARYRSRTEEVASIGKTLVDGRADALGRFHFSGLKKGWFRLELELERGYPSLLALREYPGGIALSGAEVGPEFYFETGRRNLRIELDAAMLELRVQDSNGKALIGARIDVWQWADIDGWARVSAGAEARVREGRFEPSAEEADLRTRHELRDAASRRIFVYPGAFVLIQASREDGRPASWHGRVPAGTRMRISLELSR